MAEGVVLIPVEAPYVLIPNPGFIFQVYGRDDPLAVAVWSSTTDSEL